MGHERMKVTTAQSCLLLEKYWCYVREACDKCGQILGPVRFTQQDSKGEWCSRKCRDGSEAREPGRCKACNARLPEGKRRGARYCDDACRKAATRSRNGQLSRTKGPIYVGFCNGIGPGKGMAARRPIEALERWRLVVTGDCQQR